MQIASDIIRDGIGLELLDEHGHIVADVFRCDADHTMAISVEPQGIAPELLNELIDHAYARLHPFEDGTALPDRALVIAEFVASKST